VSYPRVLRESEVRVVEGLAWHLDLFPTVLELAGAPHPYPMQGIDLTRVLLGRERIDPQRTIFPAVLRVAHRPQEPLRRVALQRNLKYIEGHPRFGDPEGFLFDLTHDPDERWNLRTQQGARLDALAWEAQQYASRLEPRPAVHQRTGRLLPPSEASASPPVDLPTEVEEQLRALGYLD
jgi:arylsulfatase A-like enzyme